MNFNVVRPQLGPTSMQEKHSTTIKEENTRQPPPKLQQA